MTTNININDGQVLFTFGNGITVSFMNRWCGEGESLNTEITAWTEDGNWWVFDNDDTVMCNQTPEQIVQWLKFFSEYKAELPFPVIEHDEDENGDK